MVHNLIRIPVWMVFISSLLQCGVEDSVNGSTSVSKVFSLLSEEESGIDFTNQITETEENNHLVWESIYNGGGVGVVDINNDGLQDIYLTGNMVPDRLYLNEGNMHFKDITAASGIIEEDWSSGVTFADINNDGFMDIYVCKMSWLKDAEYPEVRANKCYINNKDLTFTEQATSLGIADKGHSTQASFFDYNKDGFLDLYVMNAPSHRYDQKLDYIKRNKIPYEFKDHLYKGNGTTFTDVTMEALGDQSHAYGLGLVTCDLNQDGWTDIYVANDFEKPDLMFINQKNGTFSNEIQTKLKHISYSSMGMDVADINNDTLYDIAVLDMQTQDHVRSKTNMPSMDSEKFWNNVSLGYHFQFMSNALQLNHGMGYYSEIAQKAGLASTDWSWSVLLADFDNDAYRDLIVTNGINRNIKDNDFNIMMENQRKTKDFSFLEMAMKTKVEKVANFAFRNQGDLTFEDVSREWGFDYEGFSYGAAYADFDQDGDLDLIVNNNNDKAQLYRNESSDHTFLRVFPTKNGLPAYNAKVKIKYKDQYQIAEIHPVKGYQSSVEPIAHFGLDATKELDEVIVVFADGTSHISKDVKANQTITISYESANSRVEETKESKSLMTMDANSLGIEYFHVENKYNDFLNQVLLPHMQSRNGPFMAQGDVNGDGLEDLFIGASKEDFGLIYVQSRDGKFKYISNPDIHDDLMHEDMGATFLDIDRDGDLDLYVVSGGSEDVEGTLPYLDRLYINNGKGGFTKYKGNLPASNGSIPLAVDVNKDGWVDLFIGGRGEGLRYPYPGYSHLLMNDKGMLKIDTTFIGKRIGMVTDGVVADIDGDGWEDMILVGEWMRPTFLMNKEGKFIDETDQFLVEDLRGWWYDVKVADLDNDGVVEILCGNMGTNHKYKANAEKPLKVYGADFDKNNKYDIVLAKQTKYGEVPVRGFQCSSEQLPDLKKKFDSYNDFAHAKVDEIIQIDQHTLQLQATEFRSGYLKKKGKIYEFVPYPNFAQLSVVQGTSVADINNDGLVDILLCGNHFDAEVETVRHDAGVGCVLIRTKDGQYKAISPKESGFYAAGNAKDMKQFNIGGKPTFLVSNNSYGIQAFVVKK